MGCENTKHPKDPGGGTKVIMKQDYEIPNRPLKILILVRSVCAVTIVTLSKLFILQLEHTCLPLQGDANVGKTSMLIRLTDKKFQTVPVLGSQDSVSSKTNFSDTFSEGNRGERWWQDCEARDSMYFVIF